jgi:hypothetical protein
MKIEIPDPEEVAIPLGPENENPAKRPARTEDPLEVDAWLRRLGYALDPRPKRANAATSLAQLG